LEVLKELLGVDFDPQRHRGGVDLAFGLQPRRPELLPPSLASWLDDRQEPLVGVNVSGLLYRNPEAAKQQYRLNADYRAVVRLLLNWFLRKTTARLVLIPHVISPPDHYESDIGAIRDVIETIEPAARARVVAAPTFTDPAEAKWLISSLDWFCGTRMHSTIAGLSTGVPTAAIAYSDKTLGVFEVCGLGGHVADPRHLDTEGVVEALGDSWLRREVARQELTAHLPRVLQMAQDQMEDIMSSFDSRGGVRVV
jgi:polysaccharide pyruvyl transferase WcaK-like protein